MTMRMKVGFPRPWSKEYSVPTPYTAEGPKYVSSASIERVNRCIKRGLCTICGERITDDTMLLALIEHDWFDKEDPSFSAFNGRKGDISDPGFAHEKCATITEKFCPYFKKKKAIFIEVKTRPIFKAYRKSFTAEWWDEDQMQQAIRDNVIEA